MASELKVNKISPESGTTLTLGDSGDTINFGSGVLPNFENLTVTGDLTVDTNSLKVDSTNNRVGIGKTSPSVSLDVVGAITATGTITANSFSGDGSSLTGITSTTINNNANNRVITGSGTANTLEGEANLIFDGTNLGVGTGSPSAELHISKSADGGNTELIIENSFNAAGSTDETVQLQARFGGYDASYIITGKEEDFTTSANRSSFMSFTTRKDGTLAEKMRIDSSGNVGIGETSPLGKVHINTGGSATSVNANGDELILEGSGNSGMAIISGNSSTSSIFLRDPDDTNIGALQYEHNLNEMHFRVNDNIRCKIDSSGHFLPHASNTYDLGSSSLVWRNIYTSDFHMSNENLDKGNDVDGTKGSWTFQEGEENLYLINNKNGKKYKFNLTEIK